ncbi:MAG: CPBP family intramembrane glutamic endopeptidase [Maribacter sp.]
MLQELWNFIKNPTYEEDENTDTKYRSKVLLILLGIGLAASIILGSLTGVIETLFDLDLGKHAIDEALEKYSPLFLFFAAVVLAPLVEEFLFRGPMMFFKDKPYFKYIFYALTLIFGFYHITNFEITTTVLLLSPLLVAPQISVGALLGFIRVRFGLWWAILLHAVYNLILVGPIVVLQLLDIPLE